jgi:hypothetical protein
MGKTAAGRSTLVLSQHWHSPRSERSFVIRTLAGAASRSGPVTVVVPGSDREISADGAFDLHGLGAPSAPTWPNSIAADAVVLLDQVDPPWLAALPSSGPRFVVDATEAEVQASNSRRLSLVASTTASTDAVGLHIPVNPLAATHRHNGLGFVDYVLVLSGRSGPHDDPPAEAAWLTAALPSADIVVVEDATASVWRGRALRGAVGVDTRTDLWRLMAHARVCVDVSPGSIVGRECVESLRFGTPIVVPQQSAAAAHAQAGGGLTYTGTAELIAQVTLLGDPGVRRTASSTGRRYADTMYGDPSSFVANVARTFWG